MSFLFLVFVFTGCTSPVVKSQPTAGQQKTQLPQIEKKVYQSTDVDMQSIQRLLAMDKSVHNLGYSEKMFNTCKVGFGFDTNQSALKLAASRLRQRFPQVAVDFSHENFLDHVLEHFDYQSYQFS